MSEDPARTYTLVRGTGALQRLWYLNHRLGVWSNILVSAHYTNINGDPLTKEIILDALQLVLRAHLPLWQIFVIRPSSNKGCHGLHTGLLRTIDVEKCVEYLKGHENDSDITSDDLERAHNEWLWTADEPDRPLWKLLVKGRNVVFVSHHSIGDGMSGMVFHREFLHALNSACSKKTGLAKTRGDTILHVNEAAELPPEPEDVWTGKGSIMEAIWTHIVCWFMMLFYANARIYGDLPPSKPYPRSATAIAEPQQRTITRISSLRIPAEKMALIIDACRSNQTTFTPLLITMLTIVLATEFYPDAKVCATRCPFDLRPHLPMSRIGGGTENGTIFNAAAEVHRWHKLGAFRRVIKSGTPEDGGSLDSEATWNLVRDYKKEMTHAMSGKALRSWAGLKQIGNDLEDIVNKAFPSVGLLLRPTFSVSNIGVFSETQAGDEKTKEGSWRLDDMQFSAAAVNGTQGAHGAIFHVVGVKGGDTVINATYEEGIVSSEMAERILERALARILDII